MGFEYAFGQGSDTALLMEIMHTEIMEIIQNSKSVNTANFNVLENVTPNLRPKSLRQTPHIKKREQFLTTVLEKSKRDNKTKPDFNIGSAKSKMKCAELCRRIKLYS